MNEPLILDEQGAGALYVVATPIGNRADITLRALDVLRRVNRIAAEDTRFSRPLMEYYGIVAPLISLRQHNERQKSQQLLDFLRAGEQVALITDAGTPAISDPGAVLVDEVWSAGLRVIPIPGVTALTTLLSVAGLRGTSFYFHGFLAPRGGERQQQIRHSLQSPGIQVFYEAPHRILRTLEDLSLLIGPERMLVLGRELTKRFETIFRGTVAQALEWVREESNQQRGEMVLALDAAPLSVQTSDEADVRWLQGLLTHMSLKEAVQVMVEVTGKKRGYWYDWALKLRAEEDEVTR